MNDFSQHKYNYEQQARQQNQYGPGPGPGPQPNNMGFNGQPRPPYTPRPSKRMSDGVNAVSWLVDIGLIFAVPPLGLFLSGANFFGFNIVGKVLQSILGNNSSSAASARRSQAQDARAAARYAYSDHGQSQTAAQQQAAQKKSSAPAGNLMTVFGAVLLAFGVVFGLGSLISGSMTLWGGMTAVAAALGGGFMMLTGRKQKKKLARFRECMTITKDQGIIHVAKLGRTMGLKDNEVYDFLAEMVERGMFGPNAYIDHERGLLVVKPEEMRDVYRAEDEARAAQAKRTAQAGETEHQRYIRLIEEANNAIRDESMTRKIARMQELTQAIFQEVEKNPDKSQKIMRFMNYYLPTTLKLLDSYARIEAQGVSGENMARAKQDIERIADTLVQGYEKQLDNLYSSDAMDIASDVTVIEGLMRRDGLTGSSDFRANDAAFRAVVDEVAAAPAPASVPTPKPKPTAAVSGGAQSLRGSQPYVSPFGAASPLAGGAAVAQQEDKKS